MHLILERKKKIDGFMNEICDLVAMIDIWMDVYKEENVTIQRDENMTLYYNTILNCAYFS